MSVAALALALALDVAEAQDVAVPVAATTRKEIKQTEGN